VFVLIIAGAWAMTTRMTSVKPDELRLEVSIDEAVAFDASGHARWRYELPGNYRGGLSATDAPWRIDRAAPPAVFVAYTHRVRRSDGAVAGGVLT
jgi:hypothetical protein